jgi:hypothetical protein
MSIGFVFPPLVNLPCAGMKEYLMVYLPLTGCQTTLNISILDYECGC